MLHAQRKDKNKNKNTWNYLNDYKQGDFKKTTTDDSLDAIVYNHQHYNKDYQTFKNKWDNQLLKSSTKGSHVHI